MTHSDMRLAVLIDGDNISPNLAKVLWPQVGMLGVAHIRRVYCGEAKAQDWREAGSRFSLRLNVLPACTAGKNAADIAMAIDAVEIAAERLIDGFCLVSGDSDFTPLAKMLKQRGYKIFGFGKNTTSQALRTACDDFKSLEKTSSEAKTQALAKPTKAA